MEYYWRYYMLKKIINCFKCNFPKEESSIDFWERLANSSEQRACKGCLRDIPVLMSAGGFGFCNGCRGRIARDSSTADAVKSKMRLDAETQSYRG
jgi:hypothetical protein